jgi:hypothetical protein
VLWHMVKVLIKHMDILVVGKGADPRE